MKVLITSGGTKIRIDLVRSIINMSRGTFGSRICDAFWKKIANEDIERDASWYDKKEITFFYHKDSKMPTLEDRENELYDSMCHKIEYIPYDTFDDYRDGLTRLVKENHYDIIVLAAAVSDYGVKDVFNGKYRSSEDEMTIKLVKLPKVINEIAEFIPDDTLLCGFKLLVNSTDDELIAAMDKQLENHRIDMVIGNDLRDIKNDNHRLLIKSRFSSEVKKFEKASSNLPEVVMSECISNWRNFRSKGNS